MREIKFRAWLPLGEWLENEDRQAYIMVGPDELALEEYAPISEILSSCETIMQYTGLHDKNGKEIYEGDIVQWFWGEEAWRETKGQWFEKENNWGPPGKVTFGPLYDGYPNTENGAMGWIVQDCFLNKECRIIGNIYENPELLGRTVGKK